MKDLIDDFDLINYKPTHDKHGVHGWPHLPVIIYSTYFPIQEQYVVLY
jgi:hypothetical protein